MDTPPAKAEFPDILKTQAIEGWLSVWMFGKIIRETGSINSFLTSWSPRFVRVSRSVSFPFSIGISNSFCVITQFWSDVIEIQSVLFFWEYFFTLWLALVQRKSDVVLEKKSWWFSKSRRMSAISSESSRSHSGPHRFLFDVYFLFFSSQTIFYKIIDGNNLCRTHRTRLAEISKL